MSRDGPDRLEFEQLRRRLEEAEETLRAIRGGEVDALVVRSGAGERVFTLQGADRTYRIFVERMSEGAATLSPDGVVLFANRRLAAILGVPLGNLMGTRIERFVVTEHRTRLTALCNAASGPRRTELLFRSADGSAVEVLVGLVPLPEEGILCLTVLDLTDQRAQEVKIRSLSTELAAQVEELDLRNQELEEAQSELRHRALHDSLTGIPNRELMVDRLRQALAGAERTGEMTALLFIDLDRFKAVNDGLGHEAGDTILKEVAGRLLATVRPTDTVCRFGGDEFIVIAPLLSDGEQIAMIGGRILEALARPHPDTALVLSASIGVSLVKAGRGSPETMLREADTAMYQAKARGGNRLEFFDPALGRQAVERLAGERAVRRALTDGRVLAYYQPILDLTTHRVTGLEALARLELDDGTVLRPEGFLAVAEASGLIVPLGRHILADACNRVGAWRRRPDSAQLRINVNVSPRQLARGDLIPTVVELLRDQALPADALQVEITESAVVGADTDTLRTLAQLHDLGVFIGLDDFGTGYASLTQLRTLPIDFVKVDQSFIRGVNGGGHDETIVSVVLDLAHRLGLHSVAEGVENHVQEARLVEFGCDEVQGFLYSVPLPAQAVAAALNRPSATST